MSFDMDDSPLLHDGALLERGPTRRPGFLRPLLYSVFATFGNYEFGFCTAFTGAMGSVLEDPPHRGLGLSSSENSLFSAIVSVGAMLGALLGGYLITSLGRKRSISVACLPYMGGFLMIALAQSLGVLIVGRLLTGVGVGLSSLSAPVYVAEIAPSSLRGALGSLCQLQTVIGVLAALSIGVAVSWRTLAWIGMAQAAVLLAITLIMPESPRFLYSKNKINEARVALIRLRDRNTDIDGELEELAQAAAESAADKRPVRPADLVTGATGRAMVVGIMFMLYQQFSGVNAVTFFVSTIFEDAGFSNTNVAVVIFGVVQVIVTAISCLLVDKYGRRMLMMIAGMGMSVNAAILGFFFYMKDHDRTPMGGVPLVGALCYIASFSIGLGPIPWLMMSEIFPSRVRGVAAAVATLINWGSAFTVVMTFDSMNDTFTEAGTFFFYSAICLLGALYTRFGGVPETKGRTLDEIEQYFAGSKEVSLSDPEGNRLALLVTFFLLLYAGCIIIWGSL